MYVCTCTQAAHTLIKSASSLTFAFEAAVIRLVFTLRLHTYTYAHSVYLPFLLLFSFFDTNCNAAACKCCNRQVFANR